MDTVGRTKRRSFFILLLITVVFAVLLARLWWIQLGAVHSFSRHHIDLVKNAVRQRQQSVVLHNGRGDILDRHGSPFTGQPKKGLIIFPLARQAARESEWVSRIADIVGRPETELLPLATSGKGPQVLRDGAGRIVALTERQADEINRLEIPGVLAATLTERYRPDGTARHVLGFLHQNPLMLQTMYEEEWKTGKISPDTPVGAAGLERSFDRFLQGVGPTSLSYFVDGQGRPLRGLELRLTAGDNGFYPLSLVTTLDQTIQRRMEEVADQAGLREGSIVVLDAKTADVVAMVSRPNFDPNRVDLAEGAWQNRALKQIPPGSVFKIVVAAAAIAEGAVSPTERFSCSGEYGKYHFSCWKEGGHGSVTLEEAFAQSCNVAFAQIANRLGGDKVEEYAERLGLAAPNGWETPSLFHVQHFRQLDAEDAGVVFANEQLYGDEGALIQTAIGQRDVRITPLQAANLMATIAGGGKPSQVRLVSDILYHNGVNFYHFRPQPLAAEGVDKVTARKLLKMMQKVVTDGTGSALQHTRWEIAGKSGTAQITRQGLPRTHQWFVGLAPADQRRYAIAVVAENQPTSGSHKGTELFAEVVEALASLPVQSAESAAKTRPE